jgi:hypothetical protein
MDVSEKASNSRVPGNLELRILQALVSLVLISRGWLTWHWDSPIRGLIWQEAWWTPLLGKFGITWTHFALTSGNWISPTLDWLGIFLIASAVLPWLAGFARLRWTRWLLLPAIFILIIDIFARLVEKNLQLGIMLEYGLQLSAPIALLIHLGWKTTPPLPIQKTLTWIFLIAAALTFTGHGLYAVGYYPVPLDFRMMTSEILPLSETNSLLFLKIVGWLDFIAVTLIFIPKTRSSALFYMMCWGGLTSLARILTYFDTDLSFFGLDPWLAESIVRTPHWLIPLWLLLQLRILKAEANNQKALTTE